MPVSDDSGAGRPGPAPDSAFIPAIQGLRGLAALSVLLVHVRLMPANVGLWPADLPEGLTLAIGTGGRGVELFFVISGFLIPASLRRHRSIARFLRERALRILPLFVVLHLILYAAGPLVGYKFFAGLAPLDYLASFLANLSFTAPLLGLPLAQQNAWSLTYEWLFYAWVVAVFAAGRVPAGRFPSVLATRAGLAGLAALTAWAFPSTLYFGLGLAFSFLAPRRWVGPRTGLALGLAALVAMYAVCEYVSVVAGLPAAALLFGLALEPGGGLARALGLRGLQYLGRVSYSLYLVHPFALFLALAAVRRIGPPGPWSWGTAALFSAAGGLASLAAAGLAHALVERRMRAWLERAWDRRAAPEGGRDPGARVGAAAP